VGWLGVFIAPTTKLAVWWRLSVRWCTGQSGATATSPKPLGSDCWSSVFWARLDVRWRTGHVLLSVRCASMGRGGHSGYPKFSGRVIRVFKISGFENRYPKLQRVFHYPKIWVPGISGSGSGIPELPELLFWLHKNTCTLLN
jgi:hypothetical protein